MAVARQFRILLLLGVALFGGCARWRSAPYAAAPDMSSSGRAAASLERALGTNSADWKFLHFTFILSDGKAELARREYWWDRKGGSCRLETNANNTKLIALLNTQTHQGMVYAGNLPHMVDDEPAALQQALNWQASDALWLLGPTMLHAVGTHLAVSGAQMIESKACPTFELDFDPGAAPIAFEKVWFHLDPATSKPVAWSYARPGQTLPTTWLWKDFAPLGKSELPVKFEQLRAKRFITIDNVYAPGSMNPAIFQKP